MPRWLSWLLNLFASFFRGTASVDGPSVRVMHPLPDDPKFFPVLRDPPKPELDDHLINDFVNPGGGQMTFECGHTGWDYFEWHTFGEITKPPEGEKVPPGFCFDCVRDKIKHDQRCCRCGSHMSPGDPIILNDHANAERTWHAPYIEVRGERRYLSCLGWDCSGEAGGGGAMAGHLTSEGFRFAYAEGSLVAHTAAHPDQATVVDL